MASERVDQFPVAGLPDLNGLVGRWLYKKTRKQSRTTGGESRGGGGGGDGSEHARYRGLTSILGTAHSG